MTVQSNKDNTMTETFRGPAYRIVTTRLVIRCWNPHDAPLLSEAIEANLEHLRPWMPWAHQEPSSLERRISVLRNFRSKFDSDTDYVYGIFDLQESRVLGGTGLHTRAGESALEIGYWIHHNFTHQGLATETSAALTRVAFEINGVNRVEIHCDPQNLYSAAVPRKLGYTLEATLRQRTTKEDGSWSDSMIWTLVAAEYSKSPAANLPMTVFDAANQPIPISGI
jgi:RimJ/RimL family protein N-acetyltransferase